MKNLREFVERFDEESMLTMIAEYERYQATHSIAVSALVRTAALKFMDEQQVTDVPLKMMMTLITMECYCHFANLYIKEKGHLL